MVNMRPTLLSSCAQAATAKEASFRIDREVDLVRATRVIALDAGAERLIREVAEQTWSDARFLLIDPDAPAAGEGEHGADLVLKDHRGERTHLSAQLEGADSVVMVATSSKDAAPVRTIGEAAMLRGIMTAGIVFGENEDVRDVVLAQRPYARVLLISREDDDLAEVLTALRA
jgi:uncharacterized glyoxalase superfamily protein PhnB